MQTFEYTNNKSNLFRISFVKFNFIKKYVASVWSCILIIIMTDDIHCTYNNKHFYLNNLLIFANRHWDDNLISIDQTEIDLLL